MNNDLKIAYVQGAGDSDSVLVHTLELLHDSFTSPVRITNQLDDVVATLEATAPLNPSTAVTFSAVPFSLVLPKVENNPSQALQLRISNIDQVASARLDIAVENPTPVTAIYRVYLAGDLTDPAIDPPDQLQLTKAVADARELVAEAISFDLLNQPLHQQYYNAEDFPGLIR